MRFSPWHYAIDDIIFAAAAFYAILRHADFSLLPPAIR